MPDELTVSGLSQSIGRQYCHDGSLGNHSDTLQPPIRGPTFLTSVCGSVTSKLGCRPGAFVAETLLGSGAVAPAIPLLKLVRTPRTFRENNMEPQPVWIGVDVGERNTSICFLDLGNRYRIEKVGGSRVSEIAERLDALERSRIATVALEASAGHRLPRELAELGFPVVTIDPGRARKFLSLRQTKTDENDARGLAEIAKLGTTSRLAVHVKNVTCEQLRFQIVLRDQLVRQKTALRNALRSHMRAFGFEFTRLPPLVELRKQINAQFGPASDGLGDTKEDLLTLLEFTETLNSYLARLNRRLAQRAEGLAVTKRFMAIPGVGPIAALSFYSAIENPHRFARSRDVGAYLGVTPAHKQSGSMNRNGRITKAGNKLTRSHLVMSAGVILGHANTDFAVGDWGKELRSRVGRGKARVALARKLAVLMLAMWRKGSKFEAY